RHSRYQICTLLPLETPGARRTPAAVHPPHPTSATRKTRRPPTRGPDAPRAAATPTVIIGETGTMSNPADTETRLPKVRASELTGRQWLNTGGTDLSLQRLRGKIVLLDFWTFCCINCLHVIDELRDL